MDSLIFHVEADKIDTNVIDSIKAFFGKQKIQISVKSEKTLVDNSEQDIFSKIESAQQAEHEYHFTSDQLKDLIEKSIDGQSVDENEFKRNVSHQIKQTA